MIQIFIKYIDFGPRALHKKLMQKMQASSIKNLYVKRQQQLYLFTQPNIAVLANFICFQLGRAHHNISPLKVDQNQRLVSA